MVEKVTSFGFKYGDDPQRKPGVVVIDVREMFKNPYHDRRLRYKNGQNPEVQADIRKTPNFAHKVDGIKEACSVPGVKEVYIGCTGGHHRSVYLAEILGEYFSCPVVHRDITR